MENRCAIYPPGGLRGIGDRATQNRTPLDERPVADAISLCELRSRWRKEILSRIGRRRSRSALLDDVTGPPQPDSSSCACRMQSAPVATLAGGGSSGGGIGNRSTPCLGLVIADGPGPGQEFEGSHSFVARRGQAQWRGSMPCPCRAQPAGSIRSFRLPPLRHQTKLETDNRSGP